MLAKLLPLLATAFAGGLIALQTPINSHLGRSVGTLAAATISLAGGLVLLLSITLLAGGFGTLGEARGLPWFYFVGGLFGAVFVTTVLLTVRPLGAAGVTAAAISGQLAGSIAIDRFGLFGVTSRSVTPGRGVGVALLAVGTVLIVSR